MIYVSGVILAIYFFKLFVYYKIKMLTYEFNLN